MAKHSKKGRQLLCICESIFILLLSFSKSFIISFIASEVLVTVGIVAWQPTTGFLGALKNDRLYAQVHGALMFIAWGYMAILGMITARAMKKHMGRGWFILHIVSQTLVMLIVFAALAIVIVELDDKGAKHFNSAHMQLGLVIVILTFIQVCLGIVSHFMHNEDRESPPIFPDQIHHWLGRIVVILSLANILAGVDEYDGGTELWIIAGNTVVIHWISFEKETEEV